MKTKDKITGYSIGIILAIISVALFFSCSTVQAQTKPTGKTIKIGSTIVPDTTKVYTGTHGGKYFFKLSAKSGKIYKHYIKVK